MSLADALAQLRDRALADLVAAHDYYAETKGAWTIVVRVIAAGRAFNIRNRTTGTVTTQTALAAKAKGDVRRQLAEATFQQFVSIFEGHLVDLLRLWLTAHPESLGSRKVDFKMVLDAADKDAIVSSVVGRELNQLTYEKPADGFVYLNDRAGLNCPSPDQIDRIAEVKATRDLLVHNGGVVNAIYLAKAGPLSRQAIGERIEVPESYHRQACELFRDVIVATAQAAIAKAV